MSDKPNKPQEKPEQEKPVPPRQNDPLLDDYIQEGAKPAQETKQK